ncbi:MAG TPA: hypothetical protein VLF40_02760 [Candidatus Saccharimonadales bacterium]|nr:hypothetical protein [Candidatus Saccharimonadales bacterium]
MDVRSAIRNIIVALISIGLVILVIVLLIKGFSGGSSNTIKPINVGKYGYTNAIATLVADGPTNLNQLHFQVRISVSATEVEIDQINGYQGDVVKSQTYPNNASAYTAFLQSLQLQGFSKGIKSSVDYRGFCPQGSRYLYTFTNEQEELVNSWSSSCGGQGTFRGNAPATRNLFRAQVVPVDFSKFISGTNISM